jgi:hypothetical protein
MTGFLLAGATALVLMSGIAAAQTTSSDSVAPSIVAPPMGTLSTSHNEVRVDGNGTETDSSRTTYRNEVGVADDVHTTTTTRPPITTSTSSTSTTMH